jgi:hypothetical protein
MTASLFLRPQYDVASRAYCDLAIGLLRLAEPADLFDRRGTLQHRILESAHLESPGRREGAIERAHTEKPALIVMEINEVKTHFTLPVATISTSLPRQARPLRALPRPPLSRDSLFDQRTDVSLSVQGGDSGVNGVVEVVGVGESLVGQVMGFKIAPDGLDVVEFRRVLAQPFDGEPMGAVGKRGDGGRAHVDRPVVEHDNNRPDRQAGWRAIKAVEPPPAAPGSPIIDSDRPASSKLRLLGLRRKLATGTRQGFRDV